MARQIIDLPRIDLADLADDDILIIRDSSSRKDMRITVGDLKSKFYTDIPDDAITTNKIKNGAVSSDKIKNGAVSSDKIDWTTMKYGIVSNPASTTIPANGRTRIAQITLPKGKYALIATASYWADNNARRNLYISFESSTGGTVTSMLNGLYGTTASGDTLEATNTALVNITSGQATVSVYANSNDFSGTFYQWGNPSVLYFRVG